MCNHAGSSDHHLHFLHKFDDDRRPRIPNGRHARALAVDEYAEGIEDHSCRHVAHDSCELDEFIAHMKSGGANPRGGVLVWDDGFGILKQMFAKGCGPGRAGEATCPEYCRRAETESEAKEVETTFSDRAGGEFRTQVRDAIEEGGREPFFDVSRLPDDRKVPFERPIGGAGDPDAKIVAACRPARRAQNDGHFAAIARLM